MTYRWKTRSTTIGEYRFLDQAVETCAQYPTEADVVLGTDYGYSDEYTGTYEP